MDNPRQEKVAVVEEVRQRFNDADAALLTEYRGLKVKDLATLRRSLRSSGGEYKIYKNTLVRLAATGSGLEGLHDLLVGPTAITFVSGDAAGVAKALRDYSRINPLLVIKGGVLGNKVLDARETAALAELPTREVLLAQLAGTLAAPLRQLAGLMQALPRNLAYGLTALRDQKAAGAPDAAAEPEAEAPAAAAAAVEAEAEAPAAVAEPEAEAPAAEPEAEAPAAEPEAEAPATESDAAAPDEPETTPSPDQTQE